jgi:flagellar biosynthesis protein FlhG
VLDSGCDQALGLRRLFERRGVPMLSIAGAADATSVTLGLAAALAHAGRRVLILDRTHGEAALGLGLKARCEYAHVLAGEAGLDDVLQHGQDGVCVLPAARALEAADRGDETVRRALAGLLTASCNRFDICLVNGLAPAAGVDDDAPREILLVTTASAAAIKRAYAQIKVLAREPTAYRLRIVVNEGRSEAAARSVYVNLAETARRFLAARLDYVGHLPGEPAPSTPERQLPQQVPARTQSVRAHAFARLAELLASETMASHVSV